MQRFRAIRLKTKAMGNLFVTIYKRLNGVIKSLESRNETLLKVAHCIVDTQQAFFEFGEEHIETPCFGRYCRTG